MRTDWELLPVVLGRAWENSPLYSGLWRRIWIPARAGPGPSRNFWYLAAAAHELLLPTGRVARIQGFAIPPLNCNRNVLDRGSAGLWYMETTAARWRAVGSEDQSSEIQRTLKPNPSGPLQRQALFGEHWPETFFLPKHGRS